MEATTILKKCVGHGDEKFKLPVMNEAKEMQILWSSLDY